MYIGLRRICVFILFIAGLNSSQAWAENCSNTIGDMTVNTQNIKYLPSLPINSQMSGSMADNSSGIRFTCDLTVPAAGWKRVVYQQMDTQGAAIAVNGVHIFASKLNGLGYSLGFQCNGGPVHYIDGSSSPAGSESATICDSGDMPTLLGMKEVIIKAYITFYKTGEVNLSGGNHTNVDAQPQVGKLFMELQPASGQTTTSTSPTFLGLSALNVDIGASGSCQVTTSTIHVALGSVNKSEFKGIGTTGGRAQTFAIPVYCSQPTEVRMGFFGVEDTSGQPNILALAKTSAAASGVGVALNYGNNGASAPAEGTAVSINEATNLPVLKTITASNAASAERINFSAHYVQTGAVVSAGTANSMATFTLVYN